MDATLRQPGRGIVVSELALDCLRVLMRAWPLVAPQAFDLRLVRLDCSQAGTLLRATDKLAVSLDRRVRELSGTLSLDVQCLLRDREWFWRDGAPTRLTSVPLADHVVSLAESYLVGRGAQVVLRDDGGDKGAANDGHPLSRAARWAWLIRYVPSDLLVAAIGTRAAVESLPQTDHVSLVTPALRELLAEGATQQHLHLGAGPSFTMLWTGLMQRSFLVALDLGESDDDRGEMPFGTGGRFHLRLLQAGVLRLLMADFLRLRRQQGVRLDFTAYVQQQMAELSATTPPQGEWWRCFAPLVRQLGVGAGSPGGQAKPPLKTLYLRGWGRFAAHGRSVDSGNRLIDFHAKDPLAVCYPPAECESAAETRFSHTALRYLLNAGSQDSQFSTCFWQYQRIRCALFRYLTQEPGVAGFDWFRRFYSRLSKFTKSLDPVETTLAMYHSGQDLRLTSFEGRKAPKERSDLVLGTVRDFARQSLGFTSASEGSARPEVGLVLHFVKDSEEEIARGLKLPRKLTGNLPFRRRHHLWFHSRAQQARAVYAVLRDHPSVLLVLRGIDSANRELTVATWATACMLLPLRQISNVAAAQLNRRQPRWNVRPLRLTYHSGEEFRRLSDGLRRTHELLETELLQVGDRLGHGLALGLSAQVWARQATAVAQPAEDRLDDLLWELDRYARGDIPDAASRRAQVEGEAMSLARQIYSDEREGSPMPPLTLDCLREARSLRHRLKVLQRMGYGLLVGERQSPPSLQTLHDNEMSIGLASTRSARILLYRYLYEERVYVRGQRPVLVGQTESEIVFLDHVQKWLRQVIARLGVTVESNPSSNLLIGSYQSLEEHPITKMQPVLGDPHFGLPVSINDDNSLTFTTCIADEYAHLLYSLQRAGISAPDALKWLAARQESGWQARFTLPTSADTANIEQLDLTLSPTKRLQSAARRSRIS